ncbi:MAG: tripartite tricarboxylate transporter substrate binding protein [Burkholderiales bacterium]|nr:tripartite tricarboxylate transporter substrate binding protein [Burkholderiales bacterium]
MRGLTAILAVLAALAPPAAHAQPWPARPLRLIVPFAPGGPADIVARALAAGLAAPLGQPLVVENRAGGNANIGAEAALQAAADGYTLFLATSTHASNVSMEARLRYDLVRDFAPVARLAWFPLVLAVHPSVPARSVAELIALARAKPGALNYASAGSGGGAHLAAESFRAATGADLVHVPYKGTGPAVADLVAGHVGLMFASVASVIGQVKSGQLRPLAATGARRIAALPAVPTLAEAGLPGLVIVSWFGLLAPAGTPAAAIARLNAETGRVLGSADFLRRLEAEGGEAAPATPAEFGRFIRAEIERWAAVVRRSGARIE